MKGEIVPNAGIPESFKVLVKEVRSLALNMEPISYKKRDTQAKDKAAAKAANPADVFASADADELIGGISGSAKSGHEALIGNSLHEKE